ncbi:MAG: VOC family protein [Chloroflexi bacterium]|nr:VOC family protein [Chloroflexota bacterium]
MIEIEEEALVSGAYRHGLSVLLSRIGGRARLWTQYSVLSVGDRELHIARPRAHVAEMLGGIDPVSRGHYALRVEDVDAVVGRLRELGMKYAVPGPWAVDAWRQVYFEDPDGNVVECHQVVE